MIRALNRSGIILGLALLLAGSIPSKSLELKDAVVVSPPTLSAPEKKAVTMLLEEVEKRTHVRWPLVTDWPVSNAPVIAVGPELALERFAGNYRSSLKGSHEISGAEGYRLCVKRGQGNPAVLVIGKDARGVLFGVGRLLRELHMRRGSIAIEENLDITSSPKYPLRGHQLGYRPKCNSYDAWDLPVWEQYFRDLAVFGCNAIELIPPRSDDAADSPHFPRPQMEMMIGMSGLAADYGLDVWIWYPAMDRDYSNPATVQSALKEWGDVFRKLPRIDAVFVPGGDPGDTQPKYLMALLEKQTDNLRRYHPNAQMWVSPQSFNQAWLDEFIEILQRQRPAWLKGVVYGPQVRVSLPRLRELVPDQYPIRHYPDITHSRQCQYPVPDWDIAYALTEGRECINPRPEGEAVIFRKTQPQTLGFLTYSEGCNDDVNKTVWSALGWDPDAKVPDILREYSRYFIGEDYAESFSQGLLALERDWRGPLLKNKSVDATLSDFRAMEKKARPADLKNWRFQQALFRAYYDAYVQHRLIFQTDQEARAMDALRGALAAKDRRSPSRSVSDPAAALDAAEKILDATVPEGTFEVPALAGPDAVPPAKAGTSTARTLAEWRTRIHELAEALFQSIGMQLSASKYKAIGVDRGAMLDTLEYPLNNRRWLKRQFARIRSLSSEAERLAAISEIVHWTDPGPGGFYDDLGNPAQQPHLMRGLGFNGDPGAMQSPRSDWDEDLVLDEPDDRPQGPRRISWMDHAESLYDAPLQMHYTGLDPKANYKLRVVYGGDSFRRKIRLVAGEGLEIHPLMSKPFPIKPIEFPIPKAATERGELTLTWTSEPGLGGNGRNCQVSELWLLKQGASPGR